MSNTSLPVCRGVRGATTAPANTIESILEATRELLSQMVAANEMAVDQIASILFTMTTDLDAEYPALAARQMGWLAVPMLCAQEIGRPDALPRTIRVLIHWNTTVPQDSIRHIYINGAEILRPDRAEQQVAMTEQEITR